MRVSALLVLAWLVLWPAGEVPAAESSFSYEELRFRIPDRYGERKYSPSTLPDSKIPDVVMVAPSGVGYPYGLRLRAAVIPGFPPGSDSLREQEKDLYFVAQLLDKWMNDTKKEVTSWGRTDARRVTLGGHLALRASWVGMRAGRQYNGVFYCMLIGAKIFDLDVMGPGARPDVTLMLATSAIDRLTIVKTP